MICLRKREAVPKQSHIPCVMNQRPLVPRMCLHRSGEEDSSYWRVWLLGIYKTGFVVTCLPVAKGVDILCPV